MNQTSLKWDWIQGEILQSNYSNYKYFDNHSYFTTIILNSVMMTTIAILMIHYYQEDYLTLKLSTNATFWHDHIINAQLLSDKSLIQQDIPAQRNTEKQQDINTEEGTNKTNIPLNQNRTYSTMLKLISGALVGRTNYCDVYTASDMGDNYRSRARRGENDITIPTPQEVA